MKNLYEILVPCQKNNGKWFNKSHHKKFDKYVRRLSGGLTVLTPAKGQWVYKNELYEERVIPVRVCCTEADLRKIQKFALTHYKQRAIMAYRLSSDVLILERE
jgi:hypothetical protein